MDRPIKTRTPFGKALAKVRVDLDVTATMLAKWLDCSATYISCIEWGTREIPYKTGCEWITQILLLVPVDDVKEYQTQLMTSLVQTVKYIVIDTRNLTPLQIEVVALLSFKIHSLPESDLDQIHQLLSRVF